MKPESEGCVVCGKYCWEDESQQVMTSGHDGPHVQWCHNECYETWVSWNR